VAWLGGKGAGGKAQQQQKPDLSFIDEMIRRSEEKEKRKQEAGGDGAEEDNEPHSDDEFCLADYESEDEDGHERPHHDKDAAKQKNKKRDMLAGLYLDSQEDDAEGEGEEELQVRKVRNVTALCVVIRRCNAHRLHCTWCAVRAQLYYCSRTHSQLRQFVGEVRHAQLQRSTKNSNEGRMWRAHSRTPANVRSSELSLQSACEW
jgi:hypothetical protein